MLLLESIVKGVELVDSSFGSAFEWKEYRAFLENIHGIRKTSQVQLLLLPEYHDKLVFKVISCSALH